MTPVEYADAPWNKVPICYLVYKEYVPKRKFVEGLHRSIGHSMYSYWSLREYTTVHKLARNALLLTSLQQEL